MWLDGCHTSNARKAYKNAKARANGEFDLNAHTDIVDQLVQAGRNFGDDDPDTQNMYDRLKHQRFKWENQGYRNAYKANKAARARAAMSRRFISAARMEALEA